MTADILYLPDELGGWSLECDSVEQASEGGWDVQFISYTTQHANSQLTLRVGITQDDESGLYEVGVAAAFTETYEQEPGIESLDAALHGMVDLMATYAPDAELIAIRDEMGSSPVMAR